MPKPFLLESFEKHKTLGIRSFNSGDVTEAKYHFLKAAEYLLELARQSEEGLREVRTHVEAGDAQIVDARSPGRFAGAEPEPRPGVEPGHIPGAFNLPYSRLFEADGRWKSPDAIASEFAAAGVDPARPMVATCGSGITACVLAFGAERIGGLAPVYDGSWTEWGSDPSTPKAKDA